MNTNQTKKYKILFVDDDKFLVDMYALKFKERGINVDVAFCGKEAIDKIRGGGDYDVIVLDLVMPGMDGFETLENIRNEKLSERSVFIILSNQSQPDDIEKARRLSVDGYLIKANTIPSEVLDEVFKSADKKFKN